MPHSKKENKLDRKESLLTINEICELKNCNNCVYLELRKKQDLYMWISKPPQGPSTKFLVENVHTSAELNLIGNCLRGSRPILSFDKNFDSQPHLSLLKEVFIQSFGTTCNHPLSKPFFDHVFTFSIVENRIWFRNYQICETTSGKAHETSLIEIGPRFVLNPIRIFSGSFCGSTLFQNPLYTSPNFLRAQRRKREAGKYASRVTSKKSFNKRKSNFELEDDELEDIFK